MGLVTFQAGSRTKSHHIASGGERGGRTGAVLFIRRAIPQRQMGVNNIRERGFAMLRTSIRDGKPSQDHPRKINTRSLSPVPKEAEGGRAPQTSVARQGVTRRAKCTRGPSHSRGVHPVEFGHNKHRLERQKEADQEEEERWKKVASPDCVTLSPRVLARLVGDSNPGLQIQSLLC